MIDELGRYAEAGVTLVVVQVTLLPQAIPDSLGGSPPR